VARSAGRSSQQAPHTSRLRAAPAAQCLGPEFATQPLRELPWTSPGSYYCPVEGRLLLEEADPAPAPPGAAAAARRAPPPVPKDVCFIFLKHFSVRAGACPRPARAAEAAAAAKR
jgi:hypothetical protein